jgi:transcriptional regulator with XRE-family HTH domain
MKVKKARRKGVSQWLGVAEVARATGLTVGHVSQVLRGKRQSARVLAAARGVVRRVAV